MQQMDAAEPAERRLTIDNRQYTADEFKVVFGENMFEQWEHYWTGNTQQNDTNQLMDKAEPERRLSLDNCRYTLEEFKQFFDDRWEIYWNGNVNPQDVKSADQPDADSHSSMQSQADNTPRSSTASAAETAADAEAAAAEAASTRAARGQHGANAPERRRASDNLLYTAEEFEQFFGSDWERHWSNAAGSVQRHASRNRGRGRARAVGPGTCARSPAHPAGNVQQRVARNGGRGRGTAVSTGASSPHLPAGNVQQHAARNGGCGRASAVEQGTSARSFLLPAGNVLHDWPTGSDARDRDIRHEQWRRLHAHEEAHPYWPFIPGVTMYSIMVCCKCLREMHVSFDNCQSAKMFTCEHCWSVEFQQFVCPGCNMIMCTRCIAIARGTTSPAAMNVSKYEWA